MRYNTYTLFEYYLLVVSNKIDNPRSISEVRWKYFKIYFPAPTHTPKCIECGLGACFAAKEYFNDAVTYGIYGVKDGKEIRFTIDHKMAQGLGGSRSKNENLQPMCYPCNNKKSAIESKVASFFRRTRVTKQVYETKPPLTYSLGAILEKAKVA